MHDRRDARRRNPIYQAHRRRGPWRQLWEALAVLGFAWLLLILVTSGMGGRP